MLRTFIAACCLLTVLAACQGGDGGGGEGGPSSPPIIQWDRDPLSVVFRAEVAGGNTDPFLRLSEVPLCTIYGDNRVVWTSTIPGSSTEQVLFDVVSDQQIFDFVGYLTVEQRIYTFDAGADRLLPSEVAPVYERLTLSINAVTHVTDDFADWPSEGDYFQDIVDACQRIARSPRRFEPQGAWVSARNTSYDLSLPSIFWEPDPAGFSITELAGSGERRWLEGDVVRLLWIALQDNTLAVQFNEADVHYTIAIQVPGVTLDAPPAPQQS